MRALHWDGTAARVIDRPAPSAGPGTAVVRVTWAGICQTDLEICKGYMGFRGVLGHEFVGVVVEGPDEWMNKRVVGEINFGCGACPECARGMTRHCPRRTVMGILDADGAFAEKIEVPVENLHAVPDAVSDEAAVFAEPLAAAFEILEQIHVHAGLDVTVLGDGKLGLLVAQVLHLTGARVLAVGRHGSNLSFLAKRGISTTLADAWSKKKADVVVDATGSAAGFEAAVAACKPRGTLVLKSTVAGDVPMNLSPLVIQEIRVIGSRCGSFAPALRALNVGSVDVTPLVGARVPLREADRGLALAAKPGMLKVLIDAG